MNIFFNYIPAKKNKGLILQVIPRLIEGWKVKYITGSGQTMATKDRVHIYETEGHVKPFHRGKERNKPKEAKVAVDSVAMKIDSRCGPQLNTKKRQIPPEFSMSDEEAQRKYLQSIALAHSNSDARILASCSWSDSIVTLARSYGVSENKCMNSNLIATAAATVTSPILGTQIPLSATTDASGATFEQQQEALKRQISEQQNMRVERIPSFDSAFPPILGSPISREVSWDKDLNGPGDNHSFPHMKPVVNHCLWF